MRQTQSRHQGLPSGRCHASYAVPRVFCLPVHTNLECPNATFLLAQTIPPPPDFRTQLDNPQNLTSPELDRKFHPPRLAPAGGAPVTGHGQGKACERLHNPPRQDHPKVPTLSGGFARLRGTSPARPLPAHQKNGDSPSSTDRSHAGWPLHAGGFPALKWGAYLCHPDAAPSRVRALYIKE